MFPPSIVRAVARLLCAVLVSLAAQRASADPENFELRAPATWFGQALVQSPDGGVTNWGIGAFVYAETWNNNNGWWDGYAALANVAIDPDDGTQHWTFMGSNGWTCTVDAAAVANARNADHVLWLDFEPGSESFTWNFLVSSDYAGHALGLVQPGDGDGPPTVSPLSLGDSISMLSGEGYGPGFSGVRASAPVDSSKPFWVADFTTGLRSQNGATLLRDGWVADAQPHPLVSVSVYFDAISSGDRYTLHWQLPGAMQSEMVQSLTAVSGDAGWQQMGNWGSEDLSGTVGITGSVAVGSNYWVTRDSDGWSSSSWFLNPLVQWPDPIRWALRGMAAPPVPWRTATFNIAAGCGWSAYVAQQDGMRGLTPASTGTLTFSDTDDWGNPHDFYYEQWTTQIDPREPFWLTVNYTQCTQGETWYYNGWTAIGGTPRNFQNVSFGISAGFGGNASVYQGSNGSQGLTLQGTGFRIDDYLNGGPADGTPNVFTYDLWNATLDVNRPFFLSVNGTTLDANQAWYYNGWQWQGGGVPNWQVVNFTIASGYGWSNSFVTQTNNWQSLSFIGQSGYTEDYWNDGSGTPNFFYYDIFSAQVDISRPYTLSVNGQPLDPGVSAFYNGWQWQGGARTLAFTLNLTMNGDRVNHDFTLTAPDGRSQALALSGSQITAEIGLWNQWVPEMWNYSYSTFSSSQGMTWDGRSGVWTLTDAVTSETVTFDPSGSASYAFDLGQWWLPSTSIQLQISLSRWGHELHLRQRDGQDYLVTPGSSQGGLIQTPDGSWFQSYYYFDAGSYRREISGWDWWIYDATTNESSPANASNLIGWIYPATPVNAASWITADNGVEVRWELPAVFDTTILDGGFTIEATDIAGGSWSQVSQNTARNYLRNDASGFQFRFGDSMGTSGTGRIYRVMLSYGGVSSVAAQTNAIQFPSTGGDGGGDGGGTTYQTFTAVSSTVTVSAGGGMTINLQANGGTEPYTFYYGTQTPSQGSLTLAGSAGSYSANASGSGQDSFTFIVQDAAGTSATGTITINIQAAPPTDPPPSDPPPNDPPNNPPPDDPPPPPPPPPTPVSAQGQTVHVTAGKSQSITLSANNGTAPYSYSLSSGADSSKGLLSSTSSDTYTYAAKIGAANGCDSFSFMVQDTAGAYDSATVNVVIDPPSGSLTAQDQTVDGVVVNQSVHFTLTASGGDGTSTVTFAKATDPQYGTVSVSGEGSGTYTAGDYFPGSDTFTFTASDGSGADPSTGTVTLTGTASPYPRPSGGSTQQPPNALPCDCEMASGKRAGMASYKLDFFSGGIQIRDFPLPYASPFGPASTIGFQYNSVDVSENGIAALELAGSDFSQLNFSGLAHTHLGPRWRLNWAQFITDHPGQDGSVDLIMAQGGAVKMPNISQETGRYGRTGVSADTIEKCDDNSYVHWLADGSWECYTLVGGLAADGRRHLFLTQISDPQGNITNLNWVAVPQGVQLSAIMDASGKVTSFSHDDPLDPLRLTKVTDPFGRTCTLQYNAAGNLWKLTDPVGIVSEFTYEPGGNAVVSSMTTPYGVTSFSSGTLDGNPANGRFAEATRPAVGGAAALTERVVRVRGGTEPQQAGGGEDLTSHLTYYWTPQGHAAGTDVANAQMIRWAQDPQTFDPVELPAIVQAPLTYPQYFLYTGQTQVGLAGTSYGASAVFQEQPDNSWFTTLFTYNAEGKLLSVTDPQGRQALYAYQNNGRDVSEVHHLAGGQDDRLVSFPDVYIGGKPTTIIAADGGATHLIYNAHGQVQSLTNALGEVIFWTYEDNLGTPAYGRMKTETSAFGTALAAMTQLAYDDYGRLASVTDSDNDTVTFTYDAIGGDPLASLDRVTTTNGPDGSGSWVLWDKLDVGEQHEFHPNSAERVTTYTHDANRKVTGITFPSGKTVSYIQGNCCGAVDTLVDSANNRTHWEYDVLGRMTGKWLRWGQGDQVQVKSQTYDAVGRLSSAQDARGNIKSYTYDAEGRLGVIQYVLGGTTKRTDNVFLGYEPLHGRVATVLDGTGTTSYSYIPVNAGDGIFGDGSLASESKVLADGTPLYTNSYAYDGLGRRVSGPRQGSAEWDALGRLNNAASGLGTFGFGYEGKSGRLSRADTTLTDGAVALRASFTYDGNNSERRLTGIIHQRGDGAGGWNSFSQHGYTYDTQGRLRTWQQWAANAQRTWTLSHDGDDQLAVVDESGTGGPDTLGAFSYGYDDAGNRTSATARGVSRQWGANGLNQITSQTVGPENGMAFTYDLDGNTLSDGVRSYEWDAENRLVAANYGNAQRVEWSYDAYNRRTQQRDIDGNGGIDTRDLIWEGLSLIESRDHGTDETRRYYGNGEERLTTSTQALMTRLYYTRDHLGSVRELVDGSGTVLARYEYGPYGERTKRPGDLNCDFGYTGHYTHDGTGLVLAPYRGYDPILGRWLSRDPIEEEGGITLYTYVHNRFLERTDPTGLTDWSDMNNFKMSKVNASVDGKSYSYNVYSLEGLKAAMAIQGGFNQRIDPGQKISNMEIIGHGEWLGSTYLAGDSFENLVNMLDNIMSPDGTVYLDGCKSDKLAERLSQHLPGRKFSGNSNDVRPCLLNPGWTLPPNLWTAKGKTTFQNGKQIR